MFLEIECNIGLTFFIRPYVVSPRPAIHRPGEKPNPAHRQRLTSTERFVYPSKQQREFVAWNTLLRFICKHRVSTIVLATLGGCQKRFDKRCDIRICISKQKEKSGGRHSGENDCRETAVVETPMPLFRRRIRPSARAAPQPALLHCPLGITSIRTLPEKAKLCGGPARSTRSPGAPRRRQLLHIQSAANSPSPLPTCSVNLQFLAT